MRFNISPATFKDFVSSCVLIFMSAYVFAHVCANIACSLVVFGFELPILYAKWSL